MHHDEESLKSVREQITMLVMSIEGSPKDCEGFTAAFNTLDMFAGEHESLGEVVGRGHKRIFDAHTKAIPDEDGHDKRCALAPPNSKQEEWAGLGSEY